MGNQCCTGEHVIKDLYSHKNKPIEPPNCPAVCDPIIYQNESVNNYFAKNDFNAHWMLEDDTYQAEGEESNLVYKKQITLSYQKQASDNMQPLEITSDCIVLMILNPMFSEDTKSLENCTADSPFVDSEFQASIQSLCANMADFPISYEIDWIRAPNFYTSPNIFYHEPQPTRILAGQSTNFYFLSALSCLAEYPSLLTTLFDIAASSTEKGFYSVWLNHDGIWKSIVVDDYFPCSSNSPVFSRSTSSNELWVLILEKAYAKLYGTYHALTSEFALPEHAITDLSGSPYETISTTIDSIDATWKYIFERIIQNPTETTESAIRLLLADANDRSANVSTSTITAHTILDAKEVTLENGSTERIVKLRNHWEGAEMWLGDWSESSHKWTPEIREQVKSTAATTSENINGTFWMSIESFCMKYSHVSCNYLHLDYLHNSKLLEFSDSSQFAVVKMSAKARNKSGYLQFHQKDVRNKHSNNDDLEHAYNTVHMMAFSGHPQEIGGFLGEITSNQRNAFIPIQLGLYRDFFVIIAIEDNNTADPIQQSSIELTLSSYMDTEVWFSNDEPMGTVSDEFIDACLLRIPPMHSSDEHVYPEDEQIFRITNVCFGYMYFAYINESKRNELEEHVKISNIANAISNHNSTQTTELSWNVHLPPQTTQIKKHKLPPQYFQAIDITAHNLDIESKITPKNHSAEEQLIAEIMESSSIKRARKVDGVDQAVYFYNYISAEGTAFYYENQTDKTYGERLKLVLVNLQFADGSSVPEEIEIIIPPGQGKLLSFKPIKEQEKTSFKLNFFSFFK